MTDQSKQVRDAVAVLFQKSTNQAAFEEGIEAIFKDSAQTKQQNAMVLVMRPKHSCKRRSTNRRRHAARAGVDANGK